jgi:hypothetical protein
MAVVCRLSLVGVADGDLTNASAGPGDTPVDIVTGDVNVATDAGFNGKVAQFAQVAAAACCYEWQLAESQTDSGGRIAFRHVGVLGASWPIVGASVSGGSPGWRIDVSGPGRIRVRDNTNTQRLEMTTVLVDGTKYYIQWTQTPTSFHIELLDDAFAVIESDDLVENYGPFEIIKIGNTLSTPTVPSDLVVGEVEILDEAVEPGPWVEWDPAPILHSAVVNLPKKTSVVVGVITEATTEVQVIASLSSDLSSPINGTVVTPAASGWANSRVIGLAPDTVYHLGLLLDGVDPGWRGQIRTKPLTNVPLSYSALFGSCQETGSNHVVFDAMTAVGARFLAHMGDFGYHDTDSESVWRAGFRSTMAAPRVQGMLESTPMKYVPDNHDWGGEFSDASSAAGTFVPPAVRELMPTGLVDGAGLWSSWVLGRVRHIMLDTRSQRDPYDAANGPTKTMLGSAQKAWLKFMLQHAAEPVIVIWCSIIWTPGGGPDRWASYPDEFSELTTFITGLPNVQAKVYVGSGDAHLVAAHSGAGDLMSVPRVVGAAFDSGGTTSPETWDQGQHGNLADRGQFGVLEIDDAGSAITLHFEGRQDDDAVLVDMDTVYPSLAAPLVYRWSGKGLVDGATVAAGTAGVDDDEITAVNGTAPTIDEWDDRGTWITFPVDVSSYVVLATYDDAMPTQTWSLYVQVPEAGASRVLAAWDGSRGAIAYVVDIDASGVASISTGAGAFLGAAATLPFGQVNRLNIILDHGDLTLIAYEGSSIVPLGSVTGLLSQEFTPNELWVGPTFAFDHPELQVGHFRRTNAGVPIAPVSEGGSGTPGGTWIGRSGLPGGTPLSEVIGWSR